MLLVGDEASGAWRLEIALADGAAPTLPADLRRRHGRGWTLCGGPDGAFIQPWNEKWRQVGPATAGFLDQLAATLTPPAEAGRQRLVLTSWDDLPAGWRPPGPPAPVGGRLHRHMVVRGLGRGGDGLVVTVDPTGTGLRLTTTRWPVVLEARPGDATRRGDLPAEAFLPLWPLAEFGS